MMAPMSDAPETRGADAGPAPRRVNGLLLLFLLILLGLGASSAFFRWKAPAVAREIDRQAREAPTEPVARVGAWLKYGGPQVHNRLQFLRLSSRMPWLVSHVVEDGHPDGPAIYGLDLAALPQDIARQDGLRVIVTLPAPGLLGRGEPVGENARDVPRFASEAEAPDVSERVRALVTWALSNPSDMPGALAEDIPGATMTVEVARAEDA